MENLLIATFQNKEDAVGGLGKLKDLEELDDIIIYNVVVLQKKKKSFEVLYQEGLDTQDFPVTGSLIGAVGGRDILKKRTQEKLERLNQKISASNRGTKQGVDQPQVWLY